MEDLERVQVAMRASTLVYWHQDEPTRLPAADFRVYDDSHNSGEDLEHVANWVICGHAGTLL